MTAVGTSIKAGVLYFTCVFGAGFLLGAMRVTLLVPRLGVRTAELLEMPVMLIVIVVAARWVVRRCALPNRALTRLAAGAIALGLLLLAEFSLVLWLRGMTIAAYFAGRDPVSGTVYAVILVVFAVMPLFVERR